MSESFRPEAEKHWAYTEDVMLKVAKLYGQNLTDEMRELIKYIYVEAMIHGHKHAINNQNKTKGDKQ